MSSERNGSLRKSFFSRFKSRSRDNLAEKPPVAAKNETVGTIAKHTSKYEFVARKLNDAVNDVNTESIIQNSKLAATKGSQELTFKLPTIKANFNADFLEAVTESVNESSTTKISVFNLTDLVQNNRLNRNLSKIKLADELSSKIYLDFSGLESLTDYGVYQFCEMIKKNKKIGDQIKFSEIKLSACRYVSVWALQYLSLASGITLFDLYSAEFMLGQRLIGCERISRSMSASLEHPKHEHRNHTFTNTTKTVIINEDTNAYHLINRLKSNSTENTQEPNRNVCYKKIDLISPEVTNKFVNVFETPESLCDLFISERCLIIITFAMKDPIEIIIASLVRRLLKVAAQDVLPSGILFVGFGELGQDHLAQIEMEVKNEILNIQANLTRNLTDFKKISEVDFETEMFLSGQLNLSHQLEYIKNCLSYATLVNDIDDKLDTFDMNSNERMKRARELRAESEAISKKLVYLSRNRVAELINLSYPPTIIKYVAESVCYLFAKSPSYVNFKRLLKQHNFVSLLTEYDKENVSDFVMDKIGKFIDTHEFTPEHAGQISETARVLCEWIRFVHSYKIHANETNTGSTSYTTITEFIRQNSYFNFCWPIYYGKLVLQNAHVERMNTVLQELNDKQLLPKNFLRTCEYSEIFTHFAMRDPAFESIISNLEQCRDSVTLSSRFLMAEATRGNCISHTNGRFVVTNPGWFCKLLGVIVSSAQTTSNGFEHLATIIGNDVPIWTRSCLELVIEEEIAGKSSDIIEFLCEMRLVTTVRSSTEVFVLPIYLFKEVPPDGFSVLWPENWAGHEIKQILSLLVKYLDLDQTALAWRSGFINKNSGCIVLVSYANNELTLAVRILNPETQFNVPTKSYLYFARFVFMEYLLCIKYTLAPYLLGQKVNESDTRDVQLTLKN